MHSAQRRSQRSLQIAQTSLEVSGPLGAASLPYAALYSDLRENGKSRLHTRSRRKRRSLVCIQQCTLHRFTSVGVVNIKADGCVSPKTEPAVHPGYL